MNRTLNNVGVISIVGAGIGLVVGYLAKVVGGVDYMGHFVFGVAAILVALYLAMEAWGRS